ncbi:MAG TPA: hypothetical protein VFQ45_20005 [Longimicrobium sp.]|nr:hypothetical protein [Longimicrobium sp.]
MENAMNDGHPLDLSQDLAGGTGQSRELSFFAVSHAAADERRPRWRCLSSLGCASTIGGCALSLSSYACVAYCAADRLPGSGGDGTTPRGRTS